MVLPHFQFAHSGPPPLGYRAHVSTSRLRTKHQDMAGMEAFLVIDQKRSSANWPLAKILQVLRGMGLRGSAKTDSCLGRPHAGHTSKCGKMNVTSPLFSTEVWQAGFTLWRTFKLPYFRNAHLIPVAVGRFVPPRTLVEYVSPVLYIQIRYAPRLSGSAAQRAIQNEAEDYSIRNKEILDPKQRNFAGGKLKKCRSEIVARIWHRSRARTFQTRNSKTSREGGATHLSLRVRPRAPS